MGTLNKLRNNSKPVIWFVIIGVMIGFVGAGLFTVIGNNKLTLFGIADPESSALHVEGYAIKHTQNNNSEFDYMNTFFGNYSSWPGATFNGFSYDPSLYPTRAYDRHIQTENEIKGKILSASMYDDLFNADLSDRDILLFLIDELKTIKPSIIYQYPSIQKINASFSNTHFIGFNEIFIDGKNGVWDLGEDFIDRNNNRTYDSGEVFTDGDGIWNIGEEFTDNPNKIWDEGEKFTDTNENGLWDDGEAFIDSIGNNQWDNGRDEWLSYCLDNGKLDYSLIYHQNIANNVKNYINKVASYDIKNKKYESLFKQFENLSKDNIKEDYLINNSNTTISYITYALNNIDEKDLNIDETAINQEIPQFKQVKNLGAISTPFLVIVFIILLSFSAINRKNRGKMSFGIVFSSLFAIIIIFKVINNATQGEDEYREISYLYVTIPNDEPYEDLLDEKWNAGIDLDCGLDNICPNDSEYKNPDEDGTENDGFLEGEILISDLNLNGEYDLGDEFEDENGNNEWDYKERYADMPNGIYDEGEKFTDTNENGLWDDGEISAQIIKDNMINIIKTSSFKDLYEEEARGSNQNGKLNGEKVILSKQFNEENKINLQFHRSIILDIINKSFENEIGDYFVISDKDNQDNLKGYFIGYIDSKGNHYKKTEYDKIKEIHIKENKERFIIENNILNPTLFVDEISEIEYLGESAAESIKTKYKESKVLFRNNLKFNNLSTSPGDEVITASEMQHGIITGTLLEMQPGEISNILFTDDNAYVIFMHEKETPNLSELNYDTERVSNLLYTFSDIFNDKKNLMAIVDWRGEASLDIPIDPTQPASGTKNNKDIYFDFNMFKSTFGIR